MRGTTDQTVFVNAALQRWCCIQLCDAWNAREAGCCEGSLNGEHATIYYDTPQRLVEQTVRVRAKGSTTMAHPVKAVSGEPWSRAARSLCNSPTAIVVSLPGFQTPLVVDDAQPSLASLSQARTAAAARSHLNARVTSIQHYAWAHAGSAAPTTFEQLADAAYRVR